MSTRLPTNLDLLNEAVAAGGWLYAHTNSPNGRKCWQMVEYGLMEDTGATALNACLVVFRVTEAGKNAVAVAKRAPREHRDVEDYRRWRRSGAGVQFKEWLRIGKP